MSTGEPPPSSPPPGPPAPSSADWPAQAADAIVETVGKVRDATTGPILTLARGLVYGTAIVILGLTALLLLVIGAIRLLDVYLPGEVWSAYLLLGTVFLVVGLVMWSKRRPVDAT